MAAVAQGQQVCFDIFTTMASKLHVMNFQLLHASAVLTSPIVANQNHKS